jgi:hypothetical protein
MVTRLQAAALPAGGPCSARWATGWWRSWIQRRSTGVWYCTAYQQRAVKGAVAMLMHPDKGPAHASPFPSTINFTRITITTHTPTPPSVMG